MSDLIDLNSPENKKFQPQKLTSPLIPVPKDDVESNQAGSMVVPARKSLNDNPFDRALQKTNEYINKCQDPFEIVFEKATNNTNPYESEPRLSTDFKDDYCCKRIRHPDTVKMNKTISDYPSPSTNFILTNQPTSLSTWKNYAMADLTGINGKQVLVKETLPLILVDPPASNIDLSILNQSVLNNTFSDDYDSRRPSIGKFLNKTTSCIGNTSILNQSAMNDSLSGSGSSDDGLLKSIVSHRIDSCIKQALKKAETDSDKLTDQYYKLRRSFSQGDGIYMGKLKQIRSHSVAEDYDEVKSNNISVSSLITDDNFNNAFLGVSARKYSNTSESSTISTISRLNSASSYTASFADSDNLINNAFIKSYLSTSETPQKIRRSITAKSQLSSVDSTTEVFDLTDRFTTLKMKSSKDDWKVNISNDSVFIDNTPHQPVNCSEKLEQLTVKLQNSNSSIGEDLLPKELPDDLDLSLENDVRVDNLIELHTSNSFNNMDSNAPENNQSLPEKKANIKTDAVKELEQELIEPEKKPMAATLLMELQKLIKVENNPKAVELLENLEEHLGVKCRSNVELLEMCVQNANDSKGHIKINKADQNSSEIGKNKVNLSEEDNVNIDLDNSVKKKNEISNNENSYDNDKKVNINNKSLKINGEIKNEENKEGNSFGTQKLIMDIQLALRQLLTDYNGEPTSFLENLKKVINPMPNENQVETTEKVKNKKILPGRMSTSPKKSFGLTNRSLKSPVRQSIGSISSKKPTLIKRRASMSQIPEINSRNTEVKSRADSPKKEVKKRTSSYGESFLEKNKKIISIQPVKLKSSVPVFNKTKLKKKNEVDASVKKGPLKAMIPLGNMQRTSSVGMKVSIVVEPSTPTKSSHHALSMAKVSTPIRDRSTTVELLKKPKKIKPVASSTPEVLNKSLSSNKVTPSPRHNMSWNISPVTPNPSRSLNSSNVGLNRSIKCFQGDKLVPSPKTRNVTPRRLGPTPEEPKKLPNVLNNSMKKSTNKMDRSRYSEPVKINSINKSAVGEKLQKSINSPLKEKNNPGLKNKSNNLVSKLHRRSANITTSEKENKSKK